MVVLRAIAAATRAGGTRRVVGAEARHQLAKQRALFEVVAETRLRRRQAIQWEHLLDGIGVAEEHHDFLEIWEAHGVPAARRSGESVAFSLCDGKGRTSAAPGRRSPQVAAVA
jgi:hypothetical protein